MNEQPVGKKFAVSYVYRAAKSANLENMLDVAGAFCYYFLGSFDIDGNSYVELISAKRLNTDYVKVSEMQVKINEYLFDNEVTVHAAIVENDVETMHEFMKAVDEIISSYVD